MGPSPSSASTGGKGIMLSSSALDVRDALGLTEDQWRQFETVTRMAFQKRYDEWLRSQDKSDIRFELIPDELTQSVREEVVDKIHKDYYWASAVDPGLLEKAMTWKFRKSAKNKRDKLRRIGAGTVGESSRRGSSQSPTDLDFRDSLSPATVAGTLQAEDAEENREERASFSEGSSRRDYYDPVRDVL